MTAAGRQGSANCVAAALALAARRRCLLPRVNCHDAAGRHADVAQAAGLQHLPWRHCCCRACCFRNRCCLQPGSCPRRRQLRHPQHCCARRHHLRWRYRTAGCTWQPGCHILPVLPPLSPSPPQDALPPAAAASCWRRLATPAAAASAADPATGPAAQAATAARPAAMQVPPPAAAAAAAAGAPVRRLSGATAPQLKAAAQASAKAAPPAAAPAAVRVPPRPLPAAASRLVGRTQLPRPPAAAAVWSPGPGEPAAALLSGDTSRNRTARLPTL